MRSGACLRIPDALGVVPLRVGLWVDLLVITAFFIDFEQQVWWKSIAVDDTSSFFVVALLGSHVSELCPDVVVAQKTRSCVPMR